MAASGWVCATGARLSYRKALHVRSRCIGARAGRMPADSSVPPGGRSQAEATAYTYPYSRTGDV